MTFARQRTKANAAHQSRTWCIGNELRNVRVDHLAVGIDLGGGHTALTQLLELLLFSKIIAGQALCCAQPPKNIRKYDLPVFHTRTTRAQNEMKMPVPPELAMFFFGAPGGFSGGGRHVFFF